MLRRLQDAVRGYAGGLPPTFWWLWAGMLVNRLGGLVVPYLAIYLTERRGATVAQAGLVASLWGLGSIASGPVGGLLADRLGRRSTLVAALGAGGIGMMALGFVERIEVIAPAALVLGFAGECFRPAMQAAVADVVTEPAARVRAYGLVYWAVNLGFAVALAFAGLLAGVSFTLLFLLDGATTLLFAAIVLQHVPETRPQGGAHEPALRGLAAAFADRTLWPLLALNVLFASLLWQSHAALPVDMRRHGLSAATYGALAAMNGLAIVLLQPVTTRLVAGRDEGRVLALGALLVGAGWGLNAFAGGTAVYAFAILVWTVGEVLTTPVASAVVANLAPAHLRGRYQGAWSMSWAVAAAAGPGAGAFVLGRFGRSALWLGCAGVGVAMAVGHLLAGRSRLREPRRGAS
ncbi:MDR family MFS transporter [Anaeromyxobacter diazotrophicus]|uniref:MFS transporter n=1 Tax=Anaeromyxobacter diazotrophicus TaxID=2590199 RepID=A0A7I9VSM8_9BACT|nr:MFS transporter [Anaeromyxobacter diazotrophicus]GEJ59089.1 MFS transporter [Anaeromyxobacter diazotrophicus]